MSTTEIFNLNSVKSTMSSIEGEFETLSTKIGEINSEITTALGSPDEAMYGDAGNKVLATWDENCSTLNSFIKIFDSWSSLVSNMATEYGELESGTAKVQDEDKEALNTIAKANKSSWLKTDEAKKAYVGSESTYKDSETGVEYTETNNLDVGRVVEYTDEDGNKIKDYYSLAGELIGTAITDKNGKTTKYIDNKQVDEITTKERQEQEKNKTKAKETLKENAKKREEIAEKGSRVYLALQEYKDELKEASEKFTSKNTFMTITEKVINGSKFRITHLVINDPSQLKSIQSNGAYGNGGESIYSMANRTDNLVVAVTGGFFKANGKQNLIGKNNMVISNGKVVDKVSDYTGGQEICVDKNGKIFYAPAGVSSSDLINKYHVVDTYASHEAQRLDNGQLLNYHSGMEWDKSYDRTYLCMKEPGEYYLIQGYSTPETAIKYAKNELGCTFAGSLEQGSAVSEVTSKGVIQEHTGYETISNAFAVVDT